MLLVIPVSRSDKQLIPNAEKAFSLFPPGYGHSLLVVGSPNVSSEVEELRLALAKYFTIKIGYADTADRCVKLRDDVHIFDHDTFLGWPGSPNYYFQQTCYHLREQGPWLWFELDCTPIKENWLSAIEEAYKVGPSRFMGCLERTYRGFNGELLSEEEGGKHMAACGVYPSYAADTIVPLKGVSETDIPWWSFLQWYIAPFASHTDLIQNNYKTQNYQVEKTITNFEGERCYLGGEKRDGYFLREIICDSCNNTAWDNHYNNRISHDAVLVHGCKDGSLLNLMLPKALNCAGSATFEAEPEVPDSFLQAIADVEAGRVEDMETVLTKDYPSIKCQIPTEIADKAMSQLKELGKELNEPTKPTPKSYRRKRKKVLGLPPV